VKLQTLAFCIGEACQNLVGNLGVNIASVSTSAISLLVLGLFLLLSLNIGHLSSVLERQVDVRVFLAQSCGPSCVARVGRTLEQLPGVTAVRFESKATALRNLEREFGAERRLFAGLGSANPLQDSFQVYAVDPAHVQRVARAALNLPGVASATYQAQVVGRLIAFIGVVRALGLGIGLVLALGALVVIHNAIRVGIYTRRREIHIMRLVGATELLVRLPFVLEGIALGLTGSLLALGLLSLAYHIAFRDIEQAIPFLPLLPPPAVLGQLALVLVAFGAFLGFFGSELSIRRVRL